MYIRRDITNQLLNSHQPAQILLGPRQCGKSTLLASLFANSNTPYQEITFDDFQLRSLANTDPGLFMAQFPPPLLLDEVQYVPNLFPEIKKIIDQFKRQRLLANNETKATPILFRLTGSNQILMDKNVKESLSGRASYHYLNTLSVHEVLLAKPETPLPTLLFQGGWPELYTNPQLSPVSYLNDYIRSYVEKDIVASAGIEKIDHFLTILRLLSLRTGQEINYADMQKDSGVNAVTTKQWIGILERADLIYLLKPYFNNLNKRLIKRPKVYFLDTGLATRLQGWTSSDQLALSSLIGHLFETLVLAELVKFIRNYAKDWEIFFWRTKDGQEVDFLIKTATGAIHPFEAKFAVHGITKPLSLPPHFKESFKEHEPLTIVTAGGDSLSLAPHCRLVPITKLHDYLATII